MWYFSWILGVSLACSFGILNAMWYELREKKPRDQSDDRLGSAGLSPRGLERILDVKRRGPPIVLISHNRPHVFDVVDRVRVHRFGKRVAVLDPKTASMSDAVAIMTGAKAA